MTKSILPTTMNSLKYIKAQDLYKCIKNGYKTPSNIKGYSKTDPTSTVDIGEGEDVIIVDMRGEDFIGGHIKGCINIPYSEFRRYDSEKGDYINIYNFVKNNIIARESKNINIIFHCAMSQQRGPSAALVLSRFLQEEDYENLINEKNINIMVLYKGFINWQQEYGKDEDVTEGYSNFIWG